MRNSKKFKIEIGHEYQVEFVKNKNGGKPVCFLDGKVAFVNKNDGEFIPIESIWDVRVDEVKDKFLIITPLVLRRTPSQVRDAKICMLKESGLVRQKSERRRKPKFKAAI